VVLAWLVPSQFAAAADAPAKQDDPGQRDPGQNDQGRREIVLKSESWRKTMADLDQWYSAQPIYDQKQIGDIKKQTSLRLEAMSAEQLEEFRQDVEAKLAVLQSAEGHDTLKWVAANQAAAAPAYRKKLDIQYPDVAGLNAPQLRGQLELIAEKRAASQNRTAQLERAREARVAVLLAEQQLLYEERDRAFSRGIASYGRAGYPSGFRPGEQRKYPNVVSRGYGFGFGFGFGFW
jgi:hypothetical protein